MRGSGAPPPGTGHRPGRPDPRAPTCDPAHAALQPPARLRGRVRAQAVADEVHVLGAVAQLGLRKDGASGSVTGWGHAGSRIGGGGRIRGKATLGSRTA